jgi:hypothetical protein
MDLINDLFVKAELNVVHTARRMKTAPADDPELFSALPRFPLKLRSAAPRVLPLETFEASGTDSVGFNDLNGALAVERLERFEPHLFSSSTGQQTRVKSGRARTRHTSTIDGSLRGLAVVIPKSV